jgi:nucleoid DNA-binding protein
MKITEVIAAAKAQNPSVFAGLADARAARIVGSVLAEIAKEIDATQEGVVPVVGFGRFVVKRFAPPEASKVTPEADGKIRRVIFRRAPAKPEAAAES